jgi:ATP-dependent DNA helicase RecG
LPGFRLANLVRDVEILVEARDAAFEVLEKDPTLMLENNKLIRNAILLNRRPALLFASIG